MKRAVTIFFTAILFFTLASASYAQVLGPTKSAPTAGITQPPGAPGTTAAPIPQPAVRTANCDVCGYCQGAPVPPQWQTCQKCYYPELGVATATENRTLLNIPTPDPYHYFTDLGCISTKPDEFAGQVSSFFFSIVGGIAFLYFIYGSILVATSRSDPERLNHGKRVIIGAVIGLLFVLFSVFILRFIGSGLGLPGIGG